MLRAGDRAGRAEKLDVGQVVPPIASKNYHGDTEHGEGSMISDSRGLGCALTRCVFCRVISGLYTFGSRTQETNKEEAETSVESQRNQIHQIFSVTPWLRGEFSPARHFDLEDVVRHVALGHAAIVHGDLRRRPG